MSAEDRPLPADLAARPIGRSAASLRDDLNRLAWAQRELEDARAVHARKRRTLERVRSYAEETALDDEQLRRIAQAEEELDREVELHDAQAQKLEIEAMRLLRRRRGPP